MAPQHGIECHTGTLAMPFYHGIQEDTPDGQRTLAKLLELQEALKAIPEKTVDQTLLLATWNIRDFDKPAYGDRSDEAIYYLAQIASRFDIIAIQEVYRDLRGLKRLCNVMGGYWKYLVTDATEGSRGNDERMTFLYDSRKVKFGGLAGELVLPPVKTKDKTIVPAGQVWRTPFICGFKAGWSRFMLASVHILWGKGKTTGNQEPADRVAEVRHVAQFLKKRTQDKTAWSRNLILLGDFNIFTTDDDGQAFNELLDAGFEVPEKLRAFTTNAGRNRHYDQIAFRIQKDRLDWTGRCGVFDFYQHVYRTDEQALYIPAMGQAYEKNSKGKPRTDKQKATYYKTYWRTHQMSDHLPMWVELKIDFSQRYLQRKQAGSA